MKNSQLEKKYKKPEELAMAKRIRNQIKRGLIPRYVLNEFQSKYGKKHWEFSCVIDNAVGAMD